MILKRTIILMILSLAFLKGVFSYGVYPQENPIYAVNVTVNYNYFNISDERILSVVDGCNNFKIFLGANEISNIFECSAKSDDNGNLLYIIFANTSEIALDGNKFSFPINLTLNFSRGYDVTYSEISNWKGLDEDAEKEKAKVKIYSTIIFSNNFSNEYFKEKKVTIRFTPWNLFMNRISCEIKENSELLFSGEVNTNEEKEVNLSFSEGFHDIKIECIDDLGFSGIFEINNFAIDLSSPVIEIYSPINDETYNETVLFNFTSTDLIATKVTCFYIVECNDNTTYLGESKVERGGFITFTLSNLSGNCVFGISCRDIVGNTNEKYVYFTSVKEIEETKESEGEVEEKEVTIIGSDEITIKENETINFFVRSNYRIENPSIKITGLPEGSYAILDYYNVLEANTDYLFRVIIYPSFLENKTYEARFYVNSFYKKFNLTIVKEEIYGKVVKEKKEFTLNVKLLIIVCIIVVILAAIAIIKMKILTKVY